MGRRIGALLSIAVLLIGVGGLATTVYLWFGDWPQKTRELVDHYRSVAQFDAYPSDPLLTSVTERESVSLNGVWQAVIDPYARGEIGGIAARAVESETASDLGEFSYENGLTLRVPGDWNSQDPRLVFYQGQVWYKREFRHTTPAGHRTYLWFGAANFTASVYLNGLLLGRHRGGFTPFNFDVTDGLREGDNLLVVQVDNRHRPEDVPTPTTDWLNYGGITRDVLLVDVPATFVREFDVGLASPATDRIRGAVQLGGDGASRDVQVEIPELGFTTTIRTDASGAGRFEAPASPELWSPNHPRLYRVSIRTDEDRIDEEIGFRTVTVSGRDLLLNGEPIFLRGVSIHEEALGGRRSHGPDDARATLELVRDLGANFARLSHYPHDEHTVRLADRMGILVWEEIPVYWNVAFADPGTLDQARRQLSELIARDRNRASVILWSIGNETPGGEERRQFMAALADHVRRTDPTRPITAALVTQPGDLARFFLGSYVPALLGIDVGSWVYEVHDPLADIVDVPALNQYFGWYYSGALAAVGPWTSHETRRVMLENMPKIELRVAGDKPVIISEFGAGAVAGRRAPEADLAVYSEDYQALVYQRQFEMLARQTGVVGWSPWVLKDFRSPLRMYQGVQDYWNRKGLVSDDGRRKLAFDIVAERYEAIAKATSGS